MPSGSCRKGRGTRRPETEAPTAPGSSPPSAPSYPATVEIGASDFASLAPRPDLQADRCAVLPAVRFQLKTGKRRVRGGVFPGLFDDRFAFAPVLRRQVLPGDRVVEDGGDARPRRRKLAREPGECVEP